MVIQAEQRTRSGRKVPVEVSLDFATQRGREYVCVIARDVSERRKTEERLQIARQAAETASRAKTEFLATMSHELRTPLNGVFGMIDLALESGDEIERREFLLGARGCAEGLLALVSQILDHADSEAGRLAIEAVEAVEFDPRELGRSLVAEFAARARDRDIALHLSCDPTLSGVLRGDARQLHQVLANLMANAIKFTHAGEVELRLERAAGDGPPLVLLASVRDTGIGIAPEHLPHIFEPFSQVDSSNSRRFGGVSLGLTVVHDLVHLMGGVIEAVSTPGSGSTFTCRIPLQLALAPQGAATGTQL